MDYFKGLIICKVCGKNFNRKVNNGTENLICQTRKNKGVDVCNSPILKRSILLDIIGKHLDMQGKEFDINKVKLFVREIQVFEKIIYIYYKDGTKSWFSTNGSMQF